MMFVCGQCWRNGQLSEADKNRKYCSAKARHTYEQPQGFSVLGLGAGLYQWNPNGPALSLRWAKDIRVVLVSSHERRKWTTVRPLPTKKPIPSQFEVFPPTSTCLKGGAAAADPVVLPQICMHVTAGKKCQYVGNCTFAHSVEERDLWTYMKENNSKFLQERQRVIELCDVTPPLPTLVADMDQLYEQWLLSQRPGWGEESTSNSIRENGKQIHMPTDYTEEVVGLRAGLLLSRGGREQKSETVFVFAHRLGTTAGCAARTATARNSGSSISPQTNTRSASSTLRTTTTAGSIGFPQALSEFVRGEGQPGRATNGAKPAC